MKVLILIEVAAPSRYWSAAIPLLRDKGIDVQLAVLRSPGPLTEELTAKGIKAVTFGAKTSRNYIGAAIELAMLTRRERIDIVHASESIPATVSGFSRFFGGKGVRLFHRHHTVCPENSKFFNGYANRTADLVMACSKAAMDHAIRFDGVDADRACVAYNGIVPLSSVGSEEVVELKNSLGISANEKVISIVGRLREEKGHLTLFEAAELVAERLGRPVHVVVTGSGYYEDVLKAAAAKLENVKVHFSGHREEIGPWFAIGNLVAVPSYIEPFGLVAAEAMSLGLPVIASDVGGLAEIVEDGISGILAPPKNANALAAAIENVLNDPELACELGENGRRRVLEKFTMEKMVDRWIECYQLALGTAK